MSNTFRYFLICLQSQKKNPKQTTQTPPNQHTTATKHHQKTSTKIIWSFKIICKPTKGGIVMGDFICICLFFGCLFTFI